MLVFDLSLLVFFFKQKTAYEMRISDWSSDVCSSDLAARAALFGIQQGSLDEALRARSAAALTDIGFDGYAIGGLAGGEGQEAMFGVLDFAPAQLPADKPRYLMGVGKPDDLVGAVARDRQRTRLNSRH